MTRSLSRYHVKANGTLRRALSAMFAGRAEKALRALVHDERILVNGCVETRVDTPVREGDIVECRAFGRAKRIHPHVRLLHEDETILIVEKGVGILTTGGAPRGPTTVKRVLDKYVASRGGRGRVHACHRLDRDVSGLLAFARRAEIAGRVRAEPRRFLAERIYAALVEGIPARREGTIECRLEDGADQIVRVVRTGGKLSTSRYRVLGTDERFALLEVRLDTGRRNQIRVQLSHIGHPIAGDRKYGAQSDPLRRVALHARRLVLLHPETGERMEFDSAVPFGVR